MVKDIVEEEGIIKIDNSIDYEGVWKGFYDEVIKDYEGLQEGDKTVDDVCKFLQRDRAIVMRYMKKLEVEGKIKILKLTISGSRKIVFRPVINS